MPLASSPSTVRPRRRASRVPGVDVYLLPAIVGGGLGDIDEVLCAGRCLDRAGYPVTLYRGKGRPLPTSVDGPWDWPAHRRVSSLIPRHTSALTVAPAWGVSAAPRSSGPLGRPGPWAEEAAAIEAAYGPEHTLHASLEEFARTLTTREEARERLREGGVRSRELRGRLVGVPAERDRAVFARSFRRFRAFDRPNVLHLFAGFAFDRAFAREFPDAVQTGPLWPASARPCHGAKLSGEPPRGSPRWIWYASPASAEVIAGDLFAGLRASGRPVHLTIRTPHAWRRAVPSDLATLSPHPWPAQRWQRQFTAARLRIVTGSRSLLEALELGGPFLYFNGVLGVGAARRRHRPEKLDAFLALARAAGWPRPLLRDLSDFARGRRVREIATHAARRDGTWRRWPRSPAPWGYPPGRDDLGRVLVDLARQLAAPDSSAVGIVRRLRRASYP